MQYTIVSDTGVSFFYIKSDSRRIQVKLISCFSLYCCHGNIDFPTKYIISNVNPIPIHVGCVNFTSIKSGKSAKQLIENVRYGTEKTVVRHLKLMH